MDFRMLGPLEIWDQDSLLAVNGRHAQKALVMLLDEPGRVVPVHQLIDAIWDEAAPKTAGQQIHKIISGLRRALGDQGARLTTVSGGYRLGADPIEVDLLRCKAAECQAREARAKGNFDDAHKAVSKALAEWRGPALVGISGKLVTAIAGRLDEYRLSLVELRMDLELGLGGHTDVIAELRELVADHPFREVFVAQLMLAQYRCGLAPEALRLFAEMSARIADELGVDPGKPLRELHAAILREDPSLDPEPTTSEEARSTRGPLPSESVGTEDPAVDAQNEPSEDPEPPAIAHRSAEAHDPEPSTESAEEGSAGPPSYSLVRLVALSLAVLIVGLGTSRDGLDLLQSQEDLDRVMQSVRTGDVEDPLWTYPALESGSAVMMVEAGLLILDRAELRLEADGEVLWSRHMDPHWLPKVAVTGDTIVLASSYPDDQPWNTGDVFTIDIDTGLEIWRFLDAWPVAVTEDAVVTVGCSQMTDGATVICVMSSADPRTGAEHWYAVLDHRPFPLRAEAPYGSPWGQSLPSDYLLVRWYPPDDGGGSSDRLSVYDADTGELLSEFDYDGVEHAQVNDGLLMLHKGSTFVAEGRCEARVAAHDLRSAELRWERFIDTPADGDQRCQPLPTLQGADGLLPVTLGQSASVVWLHSGESQWAVPDSSSAQLLIGDAFVTTDEASGGIAVWDVWSHEKRWTANQGELMWVRGSTLWVLDRAAVESGCGGVVGYALDSGGSVCLPGSLVYITEDVVVTADNGTWQAWPADPWR